MKQRRSLMTVGVVLMVMVVACGSDTECQDYLTEFAAVVVPAGDVLLERAEEFRAYQAGEIQLGQLSDALARSAAEMDAVLEQIDTLDEPPPQHGQGVELVVSGITMLRDAFELDPLGLATDPDLLADYSTLTAEGVALINEGTEAMGTC